MLPFKLIYSDDYDLSLGVHVFPSQKYRLIARALQAESIAAPGDFVEPRPASDDDVRLVHSRAWVRKLRTGNLDLADQMRLEIPFSERTRDAFWLSAGGSIEAGRCALADGYAQSIGGGFHHAFADHGEGFCMIHDVAIAIRRLQADGAIATALVVDTDVHQGNGTAAIFAGDRSVFTLSMHQENNYPYPKPPSMIDVGLADGTGDDEYLALLEASLIRAFRDFRPDILFYVGGADPYREDQLGGLALTIDGLRQRDALVFDEAGRRGVPIASTLAGGYALRVEDTVRIHLNTVLAARDRFTS